MFISLLFSYVATLKYFTKIDNFFGTLCNKTIFFLFWKMTYYEKCEKLGINSIEQQTLSKNNIVQKPLFSKAPLIEY